MTISSTESLHKLDAILYGRPAGRNIIDYAIETIKELREQGQTRQRDESDGVINALTDQYMLLAGERNALKAEIDGWKGKLGSARADIEELKDTIDALKAQLAEAREHNAELSTELAGANFEGNLAMIQRDEARAEVERLRPGHKAWEAWEGYSKDPRTTTWDIFQEAANIARENK